MRRSYRFLGSLFLGMRVFSHAVFSVLFGAFKVDFAYISFVKVVLIQRSVLYFKSRAGLFEAVLRYPRLVRNLNLDMRAQKENSV